MKGGKNKNSSLLSDTETPPPSDAVAGDNDVNYEKPLEVEEQERDGRAEGGDKEEKNGGDEEDVGIQEGEAEEELADAEKPRLAEGFYEIETVRRKRIRKGKIQYLIKWRGWPETANTWEPVENLVTCYDVIDAFEESLQSGKQRSTRKRKRTHALTHSQIKRKQQQQKQQHSPVDATYNVPTVKVRIIEEPVPSPPLASLNVIDHVDRNRSGLNNIEVDELANDNDLMLDSCVKEIEEKNELYLKLSELKGVIATKETCVEKGVMATRETRVEKEVMATKETCVEKGVMAIKETCVEKGVMETREISVEKGVMATTETSVEKGVMETRETSVEKGVMATRDTSVDKGVMGTRQTFVDKGLKETRETSVEKVVKATRETSVDKGVMATRETSVDKALMATKEIPVGRSENGITSGVSTANVTESLQSGRQTGAKRRKSTSVRRFKQQATSGVVKDPHDAVANATSGHLVAFMREEIFDHGLVGNALGCNNKCDEFKDTYAITEIIKAMSYSAPNIANDLTDVSVTFLAKRSDGKEVMVDNKFMKTNNPLLLISFYEKHLRHHHPQ